MPKHSCFLPTACIGRQRCLSVYDITKVITTSASDILRLVLNIGHLYIIYVGGHLKTRNQEYKYIRHPLITQPHLNMRKYV